MVRIFTGKAPILKAVARAVENHERQGFVPLANAMYRAMASSNGVGLAAPQVGELVRLFVMQPSRTVAPIIAINPKVLRRSKDRTVEWESCLSVPDHSGLVERPERVEVEYQTAVGNQEPIRQVLKGDAARIFQHELDHLDGILYTSKMIPESFSHVSALTRDADYREALEQRAIRAERRRQGIPEDDEGLNIDIQLPARG